MFMEDMTDLQLAQAVSYPARPVAARFLITFHQVAFPVGLENLGTPTCPRYDQIVLIRSNVCLGNTCYMNSTIQVLRQIPELQTALNE